MGSKWGQNDFQRQRSGEFMRKIVLLAEEDIASIEERMFIRCLQPLFPECEIELRFHTAQQLYGRKSYRTRKGKWQRNQGDQRHFPADTQ